MTPTWPTMLCGLGGLALLGLVGGAFIIGSYVYLWEHTEDFYK